ncbi:unnamed protein product [Amoebophrya sp. A120]|nr:unnamed protein product [Amoebophrya sp. A120]|eukprot:GSA120T00025873001.1
MDEELDHVAVADKELLIQARHQAEENAMAFIRRQNLEYLAALQESEERLIKQAEKEERERERKQKELEELRRKQAELVYSEQRPHLVDTTEQAVMLNQDEKEEMLKKNRRLQELQKSDKLFPYQLSYLSKLPADQRAMYGLVEYNYEVDKEVEPPSPPAAHGGEEHHQASPPPFTLNFTECFPIVTIERFKDKDTEEKFLKKYKLAVGDLLLAICGDRITNVVKWEGNTIEEAVQKKLVEKGKKQIIEKRELKDPKDPKSRTITVKKEVIYAPMVFLRKKYAEKFISIKACEKVDVINSMDKTTTSYGVKIQRKKVRAVQKNNWFDKRGLVIGDEIMGIDENFSGTKIDDFFKEKLEKYRGKVKCFLIARSKGSDFFQTGTSKFAVDVSRPLPEKWLEKALAKPVIGDVGKEDSTAAGNIKDGGASTAVLPIGGAATATNAAGAGGTTGGADGDANAKQDTKQNPAATTAGPPPAVLPDFNINPAAAAAKAAKAGKASSKKAGTTKIRKSPTTGGSTSPKSKSRPRRKATSAGDSPASPRSPSTSSPAKKKKSPGSSTSGKKKIKMKAGDAAGVSAAPAGPPVNTAKAAALFFPEYNESAADDGEGAEQDVVPYFGGTGTATGGGAPHLADSTAGLVDGATTAAPTNVVSLGTTHDGRSTTAGIGQPDFAVPTFGVSTAGSTFQSESALVVPPIVDNETNLPPQVEMNYTLAGSVSNAIDLRQRLQRQPAGGPGLLQERYDEGTAEELNLGVAAAGYDGYNNLPPTTGVAGVPPAIVAAPTTAAMNYSAAGDQLSDPSLLMLAQQEAGMGVVKAGGNTPLEQGLQQYQQFYAAGAAAPATLYGNYTTTDAQTAPPGAAALDHNDQDGNYAYQYVDPGTNINLVPASAGGAVTNPAWAQYNNNQKPDPVEHLTILNDELELNLIPAQLPQDELLLEKKYEQKQQLLYDLMLLKSATNGFLTEARFLNLQYRRKMLSVLKEEEDAMMGIVLNANKKFKLYEREREEEIEKEKLKLEEQLLQEKTKLELLLKERTDIEEKRHRAGEENLGDSSLGRGSNNKNNSNSEVLRTRQQEEENANLDSELKEEFERVKQEQEAISQVEQKIRERIFSLSEQQIELLGKEKALGDKVPTNIIPPRNAKTGATASGGAGEDEDDREVDGERSAFGSPRSRSPTSRLKSFHQSGIGTTNDDEIAYWVKKARERFPLLLYGAGKRTELSTGGLHRGGKNKKRLGVAHDAGNATQERVASMLAFKDSPRYVDKNHRIWKEINE